MSMMMMTTTTAAVQTSFANIFKRNLSAERSFRGKVGRGQYDQIWRNFATLAKVYKSLANFGQFIPYLVK